MIFPIAFAALALSQAEPQGADASSAPDTCAPSAELEFVCGLKQPEDAIHIPGTPWLIAGGMSSGGGLSIIDTTAKQQHYLYRSNTPAKRNPDYPGCDAAPDPAAFSTHGLNIRRAEPGLYELYAVSHQPHESVHVFLLDARAEKPELAWTGCIPIHGGYAANSIAAFADGALLVTVYAGVERDNGVQNGAVFAWRQGEDAFREVKGTELLSPNGLEISADNSSFYVVSTIDSSFHVFSREGRKLRSGKIPDFFPDNLRWSGDRLIAAGMRRDEPACGGEFDWRDWRKRRDCNRGYVAAEIDPAEMTSRVIAYAEPNPVFSGVSTALIVGDDLWLASWKEDRIGWRRLPGKP
jgi:hypothetical protein